MEPLEGPEFENGSLPEPDSPVPSSLEGSDLEKDCEGTTSPKKPPRKKRRFFVEEWKQSYQWVR